MYLFVKQKLKL